MIHLQKLAEVLAMRNSGKSVRAIADYYGRSDAWVYIELARARSSVDIVIAANKLGDRQMSFDFGE